MLATLAVAAGAIVQGISGVGGGFITVPFLAMISLSLLPGPVVVGSMSIAGLMAWRERKHIDVKNLRWISLGTIVGAALGAWLLSGVAKEQLGLLFGGMILAGVLITSLGLHVPPNKLNSTLSGLGVGAMGATAGIGAPILAVLYQRESGPRIRSTLGVMYLVCSTLIAGALAFFGHLGAAELGYALLLVPGYIIGYVLSQNLTQHFDQGATRLIVLVVSTAAALSLVYRSLF
ncbi:MAG: sulfite exporter TauE/SafE family protein [Gammaproteobacteria bacterium]|nr:sulfite exporter TauE/SafE family protein [Gammaproteobacteria bacterium]